MARGKTAGQRIADATDLKPMTHWISDERKRLAARIDRAIRAAVKAERVNVIEQTEAAFAQGFKRGAFCQAQRQAATTSAGETKGKNFKPAKKTKGGK